MLPLAIPVALITLGATPINHPVNDLKLLNDYSHDYYTVKDDTRFSPGRNLRRAFVTDDGAYRRSIRVLDDMVKAERQLDQPAPMSSSSTNNSTSTIAASFTSSSSLPSCTWQPESGGDPHAVNSWSGAGGYYQIMPSTWAAYGGTGLPQDAPMSEQTAVAQRIYAGQGPGAWTNC